MADLSASKANASAIKADAIASKANASVCKANADHEKHHHQTQNSFIANLIS